MIYSSVQEDIIDIIDMLQNNSDMYFEIHHPKELSYFYRIRPALNFGTPMNDTVVPFNCKLVPTNPSKCCEVPHNKNDIQNNIALVERGICTFKKKAKNAKAAGAIGIIIFDDDIDGDTYIEMMDYDDGEPIEIYAAFLLSYSGYQIKKTLKEKNVNFAEIRIPMNITKIASHKREPPWMVW